MARAVLIVAFFILCGSHAMASPQLLLLHSYHQGNEWTGSVVEGMETVLREALPRAELFTEYMDSKRHPPEVTTPLFKQYLAAKYASHRLDLILCSDDNALDFLLACRDELFPGVPVVFCGINNFREDRLTGHSGFTGVAEEADLQGTLELALQLHPKTRQIAVITDITPSGRANLQRLRHTAPLYATRLKFRELAELSAPDLKRALADLPPHSLILLLDYFRDDQGRYFTVEEANRQICQSCSAPIYSLWDFKVKAGVIGGRVTSGLQQGEAAAQMALRILSGVNPADLPVLRQSPNEYLFDYPALKRFHIPLGSLPAGSRILNRPPAFFQFSRRQLLFALAVMSLIILALLANIVRRRKAEKALQNRQARLRAIYDNVAAGIALTDRQGRYLEVNDKWAEMFACSSQSIVGKNFLDLTFADDREENYREAQALLTGQKRRYRMQKRFTRDNGSVLWVDNSVTPILNRQGKVEALVGIIIDITEHKLTEERLQAANRELDAFVRTASHDLRSPLTIIIGFAEFLRKNYQNHLDGQGAEILFRIEQGGHKMRQLLEDLLAFAQVGYVDKPDEAVDVNQVVNEVILAQSLIAEGVAIDTGPLPAIHVPRTFLLQVFDNLIGNAVRYAGCSRHPIEVGGQSQEERIRYFVRDYGSGVAHTEREQIFEPFFRGASAQKISGSGIGLATVQKIAQLYGGQAWLEETPGGGCTFWVEMQNIQPEQNTCEAASVSP